MCKLFYELLALSKTSSDYLHQKWRVEIKAQKKSLQKPSQPEEAKDPSKEAEKNEEIENEKVEAFPLPNFGSFLEVLPGKLDKTLCQELILLAHGIIEGIFIYSNSCF
jgi:hypothetical protein